MFTAETARAMLDRVAKESPEKLLAASNSVALDAIEQCEAIREDIKKIGKVVGRIAQFLQMKFGDELRKAPAEEAPAPKPAAPPRSGEQRFHANGKPMSAEQAAIEDAMDAATEGMPENPNAPAPPPLPVSPAAASAEAAEAVVAAPALAVVPPSKAAGK